MNALYRYQASLLWCTYVTYMIGVFRYMELIR